MRDLAALYHYGRLHRALRVRWHALDEMVRVPWMHWGEWAMSTWVDAAIEAGQPLEVVTEEAALEGDAPWERSQWCWVYSERGYRDTLVDVKRRPLQHEDVQRLRFALPGPWHAPLPAEAAGPSIAVRGAEDGPRPEGASERILRLRVELDLQGEAPNPWRVIELSDEASFWALHVAIQNAMGWTDSHLHAFYIGGDAPEARIEVGMPVVEPFLDEPEPLAGWTTPVLRYLNSDQPVCDYLYDFGDGWRHRVRLLELAPREPGRSYPCCTDGARACPPEDVGGPWGFAGFLEAIADPTHEEHEEYVLWAGGAYDPAAFDAAAVRFDEPGARWVYAFGG